MKTYLYFWFVIFLLSSCNITTRTPADYVNPFIGTGGHGHTYPGATLPFGMVQLSPDTRKDSWDGCSGYHYSDDFILGFSHTHLSGTGVGDYGDIRFVPTVGPLQFTPGTPENPHSGYGSKFSHNNEIATAGYYSVELDDGIDVELTATQRAGFHSYTFPKTDKSHVLIDLIESVVSEKIIEAEIKFISDHEVLGYRRTKAWSANQRIYFYAIFSKPFSTHGILVNGEYWQNKKIASSDSLIAVLNFDTGNGEPLLVKVGISAVDYKGAMENCKAEIPEWDFNKVKNDAFNIWNDKLGKINVTGGTYDEKVIFYTALYHSMLAPNLYSDSDHRYRAHNDNVYKDNSFEMHTVFSLWDTFRTLHPLFTIIEQEKTNHLINSMLDMYKHDSLLPVWELAANETNCMIGYHSAPVIVDAWIKGIRDFDVDLALKAMIQTANADQFGLKYLREKGYIPADKEGESVSKTLEYAYDDWCIAELAMGLGNEKVYRQFIQRAQYYKNIFDRKTGFFRGKSNGCFITPFDATQVNFMLTEANTWQYNFFAPQDINTHIELLGGDDNYEAKLDTLFNTTANVSGRHQSDITGLIGQYAHGNEPSHNMVYLYNYVGRPWKTQKLVHKISSELYSNAPDGLSGNEDCGQMSAWYVMSAMGFYPVTPGSDIYVLGAPLFDEMKINLENKNIFTVKALRESRKDNYVQAVWYNGVEYTPSYITHAMVMNGGELVFEMGNKPNPGFGYNTGDRPFQKIEDHIITPVPYFEADARTFLNEMDVSIADIQNDAEIFFSENESSDERYSDTLNISNSITLTAFAEINGVQSFIENAEFIKIPSGQKITLNTSYSPQYTAGGDIALINTIRGGDDFKTGNWQGYYGDNLDIVIDLGETKKISKAGIGFLQDENSWIFMPQSVTFEGSVDGINYILLGNIVNEISPNQAGGIIKDFVIANINKPVKFLKVKAISLSVCPDWHKGAGNPCWIFADEIWVE
ncbi:MAG: glycoside hydrolase family 92 protein [Bacteroidetes bacterium]|nr:glycoside hydrolase family 92 protein [Bacteroidota bacterium]MBL6944591.1 GH92 family glycosyl hydrolase [Bacteroidales bacterium]